MEFLKLNFFQRKRKNEQEITNLKKKTSEGIEIY